MFKIRKLFRNPRVDNTVEVEPVDDITDEIEKSLLELKEACDLPTEEVELAIKSRKKNDRS